MTRERFLERKSEVQASVLRLLEAVSQPESPMVRDATIQRFEFTFETTWKTLKLYLEHQGQECGGPRPTLKKAFAEGLIATQDESDVWFEMLEDRNLANHAYHEAMALRIYRNIVNKYTNLLESMAARIQSISYN
ncbi:MAG: nucleotidyltransferase substrate binding protein [Planctomycetes bacterium]|nr:nucleotidyltransferase substrate binding protein [Planctomycetota bacterium]